jgi:hypothetical protein
MKIKFVTRIGKLMMRLGSIRIIIIDDKKTYFNKQMLDLARASGFYGIKRLYKIDNDILKNLQKNPPDILILDIKGIAEQNVAKDGFGIASLFYKNSYSYVVITSAHSFQLGEIHKEFDYIIQERNLTAVDFIEELEKIVTDYLERSVKFYQKFIFKIGFQIVRKTLTSSF